MITNQSVICWTLGLKLNIKNSLRNEGYMDGILKSWLMPQSHLHVKSSPVRATLDKFLRMAVMGTMWLLQGLRDYYLVYVPLFFTKITLRGSYGKALHVGVTAALLPLSIDLQVTKCELSSFCTYDNYMTESINGVKEW